MQNHSPTEESSYATRLSGGYRKNIGLAKSLSFPDPLGFSGQNMPGDTITIGPRVKKQSDGLFQRGASIQGRYGKYIDIAEAKRNPAIMAVLMAITASVPIAMGIDGGLAASSRAIGSESVGLGVC